jgi:hypothetical protein|tara:strand:- start:8215 stop:8463 length:249 start_codon:yes stop_codon:yes gene_type:complete
MELHHPEHLEPDPLKRQTSCPVKVTPPVQLFIPVRSVRDEIIKAKTKTEVIAALLRWGAQHGINSDTEPDDDWWKKREKLGL